MSRKKIAFIRMWPHPPIAKSVEHLLTEQFPDYQVDILNVERFLQLRLNISLANPFFVLKHYGFDILMGHKKYKQSYLRTPFYFCKAKEAISRQLAKENYAFSFQLQSIVDASKPGLPHFVYTDHTHLANLEYPGFDNRQLFSNEWIQLEKSIYQNATLIFTRSTNISKSIIEQYECEPEKVICTYVGSNVGILEPASDDQRYERKNILFVGKDWERKGGPQLVEAFKIVREIHPNAQLTIVGCSPDIDVPNCRVIGPIPLEEVGQYYNHASVFCLPTKQEPFGIVFIEAQVHQLPIVATTIGAIPDFVLDQQNGYLVKPNDIAALAKALSDLIGNPKKCRAFGQAGYHLMKERYTWDKVGARIRQHIQPYLSPDRRKMDRPVMKRFILS